MILVDTSLWVEHLRRNVPALAVVLEENLVMMHPFIVGELACGRLNNRPQLLRLLSDLPQAPVATDFEVLDFIERRALAGRGIGYIDMHLLASVVLDGAATLWTLDKRLLLVAQDLKLAYG